MSNKRSYEYSPEPNGENTNHNDGANPAVSKRSSSSNRERIRVARACDRCKRKKTKCDGRKPCMACQKIGLDCIYSTTSIPAPGFGSGLVNSPIAGDARGHGGTFPRIDGWPSSGLRRPSGTTGPVPDSMVIKILQRLESLEHSLNSSASDGVDGDDNRTGSNVIGSASSAGTGAGSSSSKFRGRVRAGSVGYSGVATNGYGNIFNASSPQSYIDPAVGMAEQAHEMVRYMEEQQQRSTSSDLRQCALADNINDNDNNNDNTNGSSTSNSNTYNNMHGMHKLRYTKRYISILPTVFGSTLYRSLPSEDQKKVTIPRVQGYGWNMSGVHYLPLKSVDIPPPDLLSDELSRELLQFFFDKVNPLYSTLHKPMFLKQYESYLATEDKRDCLLFMGMFFVVCAIAMRFSEIEQRRQYPRGLEERLFDHGHSIIQTFTFQWESVELVQGWLLVTCYLRTCHRQSSSWIALGSAIRLTQGMGLMMRFWSPSTPAYELQKMTRVFWCVYTWDRFMSLDLGRAFTIKDEEIQLDRPVVYENDGWFSESSFVYLQLAFCVSPLINDFVRGGLSSSTVNSIYENLLDWNDAIAKPLGYGSDTDYSREVGNSNDDRGNSGNNTDPAIICQIRLQYHECIHYLFTRGIYALLDTNLGDGIPNEWNILASSCKGTIDATEELDKVGKLSTCWWLRLSSLYSSVLMLLVCVNAGYETNKILPYLAKGFDLLEKLVTDGRFGMSNECRWSLRTLNNMVYLRFKENQSAIKAIGIEAGYSVNERHFGAMGFLGRDGKVIPPHNTNTSAGATPGTATSSSPNDSRFQQSPQQQPSQSSQQYPTDGKIPLDTVPTSMAIPSGGEPPSAPLTAEQLLYDDGTLNPNQGNMASSLDWFSSWRWDAESSVASFLDNI